MRRTLVMIAVLFALVGCAACAAVAEVLPIKYVLQNGESLANTVVTVRGEVSNERLVPQTSALQDIKGEYDLTDLSPGTIHVTTTGKPPGNGEVKKVKGTVKYSGGVTSLHQKGGIIFNGPIGLIIALAVLVVLAIVLVVLMVRKPPPPPTRVKFCSSCRAPNEMDANVCDQCGVSLTAAPPRRVITEAEIPGQVGGRTEGTQVMPAVDASPPAPLARLRIIEGDGGKYGTEFDLGTEKQRIGSEPPANILLEDRKVSRSHAVIWYDKDQGAFHIQDDVSTNGTWVNDQKVNRTSLTDNDVIQLGATKLEFYTLRPKGARERAA